MLFEQRFKFNDIVRLNTTAGATIGNVDDLGRVVSNNNANNDGQDLIQIEFITGEFKGLTCGRYHS